MILVTCGFNINVFADTNYQKGKINSSSGSTTIYSLAGTTGHEANEADKYKSQALATLINGTEITKSALLYAKNNNWNSRTDAIIGGAKKYADGYISIGQDTYYYKDFNVINQVWWHQYAAALYDAWTSAAYLQKGCILNQEASLIFTIPVYNNMPETPCPHPSVAQEEPKPSNFYDINADGKTSGRDAVIIMQYINNCDVIIDTTAADINNDSKINNKDYVLLVRYLNGWDINM